MLTILIYIILIPIAIAALPLVAWLIFLPFNAAIALCNYVFDGRRWGRAIRGVLK